MLRGPQRKALVCLAETWCRLSAGRVRVPLISDNITVHHVSHAQICPQKKIYVSLGKHYCHCQARTAAAFEGEGLSRSQDHHSACFQNLQILRRPKQHSRSARNWVEIQGLVHKFQILLNFFSGLSAIKQWCLFCCEHVGCRQLRAAFRWWRHACARIAGSGCGLVSAGMG